MKKFISILIVVCLVLCLCGCGGTPGSKQEKYYDRFVPIEEESHLYYDNNTKIVYFIGRNGNATIMSPYYASNGFPYSYNTETNELEEINIIEEMIKW